MARTPGRRSQAALGALAVANTRPIQSFFALSKGARSSPLLGAAAGSPSPLGKRKAALLADMAKDCAVVQTNSPNLTAAGSSKRRNSSLLLPRHPATVAGQQTPMRNPKPAKCARFASPAAAVEEEALNDKENIPPSASKMPCTAKETDGNVVTPAAATGAPAGPTHQGYPLPRAYQDLLDIFAALEYTMSFARGRGQLCSIFHHIQKPVENVCRHNVSMEHVACILFLLPGAYELKPVRIAHQGVKVDSIAIYPGKVALPTEEAEDPSAVGGAKHPEPALAQGLATAKPKRGEQLCKALLRLVQQEHAAFCQEHGIDASDFPGHWVDGFDLDALPPIPQHPLPTSAASAGKAREKLEGLYRQKSVLLKPTITAEEVELAHLSRTEALLERIRRRDRLNRLQTTLSPQQLQRNAMLSRLPEILHCVIMYFNSMGKRVLYMQVVCDSVSMSLQRCKLSSEHVATHIALLGSIVPDLLQVTESDNGTLVRVDKSYPQRTALSLIQQALRAAAPPALLATPPPAFGELASSASPARLVDGAVRTASAGGVDGESTSPEAENMAPRG